LPESAPYYQGQVILRNSSSPESGIISLIRLVWTWRKSCHQHLRRLILTISAAAVTISAFIIAGGFSSFISSAMGDTILIDSANCGYIVWPNDSASTGRVLELHSERLSNAANYAQQCYTTTSSGILGCARFVTDRLSWDEDNNAPCPFAEGMCRTNDSNIRLDTGLINVNRALGLNLPANEGIAFRRVFSCAPLVTDGYTSLEQTMHGDIVSYHHGHWESGSVVRNYSFRIGDISSQNSRHQDLDSAIGLNFRLA
jgi:hypothetical protein